MSKGTSGPGVSSGKAMRTPRTCRSVCWMAGPPPRTASRGVAPPRRRRDSGSGQRPCPGRFCSATSGQLLSDTVKWTPSQPRALGPAEPRPEGTVPRGPCHGDRPNGRPPQIFRGECLFSAHLRFNTDNLPWPEMKFRPSAAHH